jgi:hypothetical protein
MMGARVSHEGSGVLNTQISLSNKLYIFLLGEVSELISGRILFEPILFEPEKFGMFDLKLVTSNR